MNKLIKFSPKSTAIISCLLATNLLVGCTSTADKSTNSEVVLPPTESDKLSLLTDDELAFLRNSKKLAWFDLTQEKVFNQIATRDAKGVKQYVSDMQKTMALATFQQGQDNVNNVKDGILEPLSPLSNSASIPLNTKAGGFNRSTTLLPAMLDEYKRTPGPINLQRYVHEQDGIPTFANAPVAIRIEDLIAGKVEVAFVGVPLALGSGWRDSQNAPTVLRGMYGLGGYDIAGGVDPAKLLNIADFGNIATAYLSTELNIDHIREQVGEMVKAETIPFIVGGDHSIMYPTVAAMVDNYGQGNINVVQLDAHYNGALEQDHYYSDAQSVSRLLEDEVLIGSNLLQVGLRGPSQDKESLEWLNEQAIQYHTMVEIEKSGFEVVLDASIKKLSTQKTFISFDMSVLDPAYAPGAGRPIPGGLTIHQSVRMVRRMCAETQVVGFEMLDVAPYLDLSYKTALNANYIMHACLTGIAMRKVGITESDYTDPLALNNSQK
ncbi:MAG: agmatinase family protein [Pseudomonadota bacterium]